MSRNDADGFTLIELLIVIVVIGILAAIAVPKLTVTRERAYRSTLMSDMKSLGHAQEVYHNLNFSYVDDIDALELRESEGVTVTINQATTTGWAATGIHDGIVGGQCGIFIGDADAANAVPATTAGVVSCDF